MDVATPRSVPFLPVRRAIIGVPISATNYDEAVAACIAAAASARPLLVTALAVHGLVEAAVEPEGFGQVIDAMELVVPDGQPVRWALNLLYGTGLRDRVYGPELTLRLCAAAADARIPVYFYGSTKCVVTALAKRIAARFPDLQIAGVEPSLFRQLTDPDETALAQRVAESGARIMFVGLGCPRQERFAVAMRERLGIVQVCVGAAFDFHAGTKRQAPAWMQACGLEWLYRLIQEPRRLLRRYAVTNTQFIVRLLAGILLRRPYPPKHQIEMKDTGNG